MRLRSLALLALAVVLLFGVAGCKSSSKTASEKAAEKIAEDQPGVEDVDIDENKVTVTGEDGEQVEIQGSGAELPDGFPSDIPVYENGTIETSGKITADGATNYTVTMTTNDSVDDVFSWHKSQYEGAGWSNQGEFNSTTSEGASAVLSFTKGERVATVGVNEQSGQGVIISYAITAE